MLNLDWEQLLAECVDFTQRLIQTRSMSREEGEIAELAAAEMRKLQFEDVEIDGIGNVSGRIPGENRELPALVLNTHLDHVDPGDLDLWPAPPYAAEIRDAHILGRGACDIKGPLAVQIYSMAAMLRAGRRPRRDVVFSGVVQEEIGGAGAKYWVEHLDYPVALVILGEPSSNTLSLGHRGIIQVWVTFSGRSVHASAPVQGENPNYVLAAFLEKLAAAQSELSAHPLLGPTTVSPTIIEVDTKSPNVTPAWTRVLLDFRTASESHNSLQAFIHRLAGDTPHTITDAWCSEPTALTESDDPIFGYFTPPDSDIVRRVEAGIKQGMGRSPEISSYKFATDGRIFVPYNIPVLGFGPGDENLAHTVKECIPISQMDEALRGYLGILRTF